MHLEHTEKLHNAVCQEIQYFGKAVPGIPILCRGSFTFAAQTPQAVSSQLANRPFADQPQRIFDWTDGRGHNAICSSWLQESPRNRLLVRWRGRSDTIASRTPGALCNLAFCISQRWFPQGEPASPLKQAMGGKKVFLRRPPQPCQAR